MSADKDGKMEGMHGTAESSDTAEQKTDDCRCWFTSLDWCSV